MKTSNEYQKNVKKGVVTPSMLGEVIYSYNKRAKDMRDQEYNWKQLGRNNRHFIDKYDYEGKYRDKKNEYYKKKDTLLSFASPTEIHLLKRSKTQKIFDWDDRFAPSDDDDVYYFYDRNCEYHEFYYMESEHIEYYLYYSIDTYSFHHPIESSELSKYDLPIRELNDLVTEGTDVGELLSVQFCDKVLCGLTSGDCKLVA